MADLPVSGIVTANGDFDVVLQSPSIDIIIVGDTEGSNNGFDGASIDIKAVHPADNSGDVPSDLEAPVAGGQGITTDFTDIYDGQVKRKLRFAVSGVGANTAIRIHTGPTTSG